MRIKEDLINKEVLDGGAELIGKVVDVVMDKDTFEVTDLVIKKTGIADQIKAGGGGFGFPHRFHRGQLYRLSFGDRLGSNISADGRQKRTYNSKTCGDPECFLMKTDISFL